MSNGSFHLELIIVMNIKAEFFETLYQYDSDPWRFASSSYELYRYHQICSIIRHQKHKYTFEAGCSIGILTEKLAHFSEFVEAIDISPTATSLALSRCNSLNNIKIHCSSLENYSINPHTDLIILSEIGYYFTPEEWRLVLQKMLTTCVPPFYILASHWLGFSPDHLLSGDEVHSIINSLRAFQLRHQERHENFRLDYWIKQ